jgi:hypothetical protein
MDLMHHEDRMLSWVGGAVFVLLLVSALFIAMNRESNTEVAALDQVLAPPITQPPITQPAGP